MVLVLEEVPVKPLQPDLHPFSLGIDLIRGPAGHGTSCSHAAVILVLWRPLDAEQVILCLLRLSLLVAS